MWVLHRNREGGRLVRLLGRGMGPFTELEPGGEVFGASKRKKEVGWQHRKSFFGPINRGEDKRKRRGKTRASVFLCCKRLFVGLGEKNTRIEIRLTISGSLQG